MKIENENSLRLALQEGINLFLGAGFSVESMGTFNSRPKAMPAGDALRKELLQRFNRDPNSTLSLPQLCQIISSTQRDALKDFFRERFTVVAFDPAYKNIERAAIKAIFTTNIDNLLHSVFSESAKYYLNDISVRGPSTSGSTGIDFIALHGSIVHPVDSGLDFSPVEIASSFDRDKDKWFGYIGRVQQVATLYWGYSVADAGVLQSLSRHTAPGRERAPAWVTLRSEDEEAIEYYSSLGFQIIVADTKGLLNYFGQLKTTKTAGSPKRLLDKRFREYFLPAVGDVPVRSLVEFYLGAEPSWYDVYLGNLRKTKHFASASNVLAGKKNCFLIGTALTGKSTLLKQLAASNKGPAQSLYIDEITPEKAKLLVRDIDAEGAQVILFIDNAADSWEAIDSLASSGNIRIVAAERDYIFDSVSHRFAAHRFEILDVSGLALLDVQAVLDAIPAGVQRAALTKDPDPLASDLEPTFFEVFDSAIAGHFLADRFVEALRELKREAPAKHHLLLLACYLYACRVPLSVDVAHSYLSSVANMTTGVDDTFALLGNMPTLLSRYEGTLADSVQAHFVPRSRAVAEAAMRRVPSSELRELLERFHSEVSPSKVSRYDIFRRMAYDANLTTRAFRRWEDGLKFYERTFERDGTHSFKQQCAIFLSRKKQFPLAFKWIDEALSLAGKRAASVRNTYAVILFNANYDKSLETPGVLASLDDSMEALRKCYTDDLRKAYHAKVFSDQAIRYFDKVRSPLAVEYLEQAIVWLENELKQRRDDRSITQLLRRVKAARRAASHRN